MADCRHWSGDRWGRRVLEGRMRSVPYHVLHHSCVVLPTSSACRVWFRGGLARPNAGMVGVSRVTDSRTGSTLFGRSSAVGTVLELFGRHELG